MLCMPVLNGSKNNLPEQTCFVHFSVSCWRDHVSQLRDEHIELISPLFLTQISRPSFSVFFFGEVIHFDVKIVIFLIRETQVLLLPCFWHTKNKTRLFGREIISLRVCVLIPHQCHTLACYVIIKTQERKRICSSTETPTWVFSSVEVIWRAAYEGLRLSPTYHRFLEKKPTAELF